MSSQLNPEDDHPRDGTVVVKKTTIKDRIKEAQQDKEMPAEDKKEAIEFAPRRGDTVETVAILDAKDGSKEINVIREKNTAPVQAKSMGWMLKRPITI